MAEGLGKGKGKRNGNGNGASKFAADIVLVRVDGGGREAAFNKSNSIFTMLTYGHKDFATAY